MKPSTLFFLLGLAFIVVSGVLVRADLALALPVGLWGVYLLVRGMFMEYVDKR